MKISAYILTGLSCAALCALGDPIVIGVQVPGSDHASAPCTPAERTDDYHKGHFSADISGSRGKNFDVVLFGDSITDFWNNPSLALDGDSLNYAAAFNMGIGSDRVQNLLWRLRNGALDGYTTKYFTLMIGINNGHQKCIDHNDRADRAEDVAESIRLMLCEMATKHPEAKILLMPILPYSFDSKYFEAAEVTEMSEAVNDYILRFVDNRRVFWVDLRSRYLQQNSMPDKVCYREGGHGGYDAVGLCLHPEFFTYSDFWRPALTNAMQKYLSVPAGQPHVADPSIGYAKAAPNADGAGSATITVFGVSLGSDANANAVTSYSIDYELDGGAKTRALSGQTGTRASFVIPDVALGAHTCRVTVTTADNRELVTLLDFSMTEPWCASPLPTGDSAVRTDGTLKYAYAPSACTVNGVQFAAAGNGNAAASGDIDWPYNMTSGALAPSSVSGAYYEFLNRCWWANQGDKAVTLKNLTAGRSYLVQIFGYRNYNGDGKAHVWIRESYWDPNFIRVYGDGWSCGGTLTGTFTATGSTKTFTVTSDGNYGINGIQVRELGASGESTDAPSGGGESGGSDTGASDETDDAGGSAGSAGSGATPPFRASTPAARLDAWWAERHAEKAAAAADVSVKKDIVFLGDGLTQGWETTGAASLASHFTGDKTMFNLGFNGDSTENVLWRIRNGELGSHKAVFLMVGGNNSAIYTETEEAEGKTYLGVRSIIDCLCEHVGADKVVVQAVLPRGLDESDPVRPRNDRLNIDVRAYARQKGCAWVDMSDLFLEADRHTLKTSLFNADRVTLNASGYEVWAQAISPYVDAASGGTAMPADLVATARPEIACAAAYPTSTNAVMPQYFWQKYENDLRLIGESGRSYDLVLLGDSLTQKWMEGSSAASMNGLAGSVLNLGRTGDFVENLHWRLAGGCLDGYAAKFFNLLIGTNNTIQKSPSDTPADIAAGVRAVLDLVLEKHPESKVLLMPIIPYGYTNAQNSAKGAAHYANNEAANEIIKTYADNRRVILVDVRSRFFNPDGTYKGEMYLQGNGDYPDMFLHLTAKAYEEILAPAIKNAMAATGASPVTLPVLGDVTAQASGTSATIALSGVTKGTDANGDAASSYSVVAKLDTAAEATVLSSQTGATASFALTDLADGWHSCAVTVKTGDGMVSAPKRVKFLVDSQADAVGWKVSPMTEDGSAIRGDGTQIFAVAKFGDTAGGVTFSSSSAPSHASLETTPAKAGGEGWGLGVNNNIINSYWWWNMSGTSTDLTFKLKGLTSGRKYLVQIVASHFHNTGGITVCAGDIAPVTANDGNDYKYGVVITRVFEASGTTENVTVNFSGSSGKFEVKAIQLRELGEGGGVTGGGEADGGGTGGGDPAPVDPDPTPTCSLTIPEKTGIVLKSVTTNGVAVSAAGGSYRIVSGTQVTVDFAAADGYEITGVNPVVFALSGDKTFSDADYPAVRAAGGNGSVEIGWTGGAADAEGTVFRIDGTLLYAYAVQSVTVNGIEFAADSDLETAGTSISPAFDTTDGNSGSEGATGDFGKMLANTWVWSQHQNSATLTLKGLTAGKRYLVQILAHHKWSPGVNISIGGKGPVGLQGDAAKYGAIFTGVFDAGGATADVEVDFSGAGGRRVLNAIQVRELPADVPADPEAPVIGGEGVELPFFVSSDKVAISIGNAAAGHRYGYRKSMTLAGLKDAPVVYFENFAAADGVLTLEIPKSANEPCCFYRIVAE